MKKCYKCRKILAHESVHGLHDECYLEWFALPKIEKFIDLDPKREGSSAQLEIKRDTFFHGRYLKFSARLNNQEYILKIREDEFPDLPAMEYACNRIASILSIDVPTYHLIDFQGKLTFVTRNFMQDNIGGTLNHIYKYLKPGAENHSCEPIIDVIMKETGRPADVAKFVEMCLFDALVGNNDRHGRNIGIIATSKGRKLSPMYDNPSYIGIEAEFLLGSDISPSGSVWTQNSKEPRVLQYISEFNRLELDYVCQNFYKKLISRFSSIINEVKESEMSSKRKEAFVKFLEKKLGEFESASN